MIFRVCWLKKISSNGETALHVAAKYGHMSIVEELLKLVPPEHLEIRDSFRRTPLETTIAHCGEIKVVKCLVEKNRNILVIADTPVHAAQEGNLPVTLAFELGLNEMGRYLYFATLPLTVITESSRENSFAYVLFTQIKCFRYVTNFI